MKDVTIDFNDLLANPGNYRILQLVDDRLLEENANNLVGFDPEAPDMVRFGILDLETTGFDWETEQPIELGFASIDYSPSQGKFRIVDTLNMMEQPDKPIPEVVTQITGLTDEKVAGHRFDEELLAKVLQPCDFVLAHNAAFDRAFFDKRFPQHSKMLWGCTITDIPWAAQGFESSKLEYLVFKHGYFYHGHQALTDVLAVIRLLMDAPHLLDHLQKTIETPMYLLHAFGVPYSLKDAVRKRGYRWMPQDKVWTTIGDVNYINGETGWMQQQREVEVAKNKIQKIDPLTRYCK